MINRAAAEGPSTFPWWKDWRGRTGLVVASGPSAKTAGIEKLKGKVCAIAIKEAFNLCPWADVVYGCEKHWWTYRRGLPEFQGLKLSFDEVDYFPTTRIKLHPEEKHWFEMHFDEPGLIGRGGNSGFQAFNILLQFGCPRVILVGFDHHDRSGPHFYGRNQWPGSTNPSERDNFPRWKRSMQIAAKQIARLNVDVVNCSAGTKIEAFRVRTIDQVIEEWGLYDKAA